MADSKKKDDPTVSTQSAGGAEYPEGTHPPRAVSEADHHVGQFEYKDNPDKPDPSTIAQVQVVPEGWPGT